MQPAFQLNLSISCDIAGLGRRSPLGCPATEFASRRHNEPEQAWEGVLQYRCGRFNFYGFKALPEPQTHRIWSTGNCLVSLKEKHLSQHCKCDGRRISTWLSVDIVFILPLKVRSWSHIKVTWRWKLSNILFYSLKSAFYQKVSDTHYCQLNMNLFLIPVRRMTTTWRGMLPSRSWAGHFRIKLTQNGPTENWCSWNVSTTRT